MITSNFLPRESGNTVETGVIPNYLGLTWTTSRYVPFTDPFLVDRNQLGGMADEDLGSPGYSRAASGIETKTIRAESRDAYDLRARRVTVPVVRDIRAGLRITGTGL
ncbi:hypothetical protein DEI86_13535 [Curtobacterium sp. MCBD17_028]|nr:hypothetical protein DEI86_13535 [Curtobacterium sp. MCBD17_028]